MSANGPATTILDGRSLASTVKFVSGEGRAAQIVGFTIRSGQPANHAQIGGGIYVSGSTPTITNNIITDNYCTGIAVQQGGPLIQGNTITMTHGAIGCVYPGTAINLYGSGSNGTAALVQNNILTGNVQELYGAILVAGLEDSLIQNNIIRDNKAIGAGSCAAGACVFNTSAATFVGNEFLNNQSAGSEAQSFYAGILLLAQLNFGPYQLRMVNNTFFSQLSGNNTQEVLLSDVNSRTLFINNVVESSGNGVSCTPGSFLDGAPDVEHNGSSTTQLAYSAACGPNVLNGHENNPATLILDAQGNYVPNGKLGGGNNSVLPQPMTDPEGNPRFTVPFIDVGAFQSGGATVPQTKIVIAPSRFDVGVNQQLTVEAAIINTGPADTAGITLDLNLDGTVVQQVNISSPGTASFPPITLTSGTHEVYASTHVATATIPASDSVRTIVHGNSSSLPTAGGVLTLGPSTSTVPNGGSINLTMSMAGNTMPEYGTLRLFDNGVLIQSSSYNTSTTAQYGLAPTTGPHLITADYQGSFASSAVLAFTTDNSYPTSTTLTAFPSSAVAGAPVTLTVSTVSPYTGASVTGSISIFIGGTLLTTLSAVNGTASFTTTSLPVGTSTLSASYAGNSTFQPSSSASITVVITAPVVVVPPDFSISPAAPALALQTQHHGDIVLTLTPINGFSGTVSVICNNLPPVATCTPDAAQYTISGQTTAAVTLHVETSALAGYISSFRTPVFRHVPTILLSVLTLPVCLLRRSRAVASLYGFVMLSLLLCILGCSNKYPASTPPGTYTLYVTATGSSNRTTVSHRVPVLFTVTR